MRKTRVLAMTIAIMMFASLLAGCANKTGDETDTGVYNNSNIAHLADDKDDVAEGTTSAVTTSETTTQTTTKETETTTTEPSTTEPAETQTQEPKKETTKAPEKKTVTAKNNVNNVNTNRVPTVQQTAAKPATTTATTQATTAESTNVTTTEPTTSTTSETSAATTTEATTSTATETTTEATTTTEVTTSTEATTTTEVTTEVTTTEETTTTEPINTITVIDPRTYDWGDGYWGRNSDYTKSGYINALISNDNIVNFSLIFDKADVKSFANIDIKDSDITFASRNLPHIYVVGDNNVTAYYYYEDGSKTLVNSFNYESNTNTFAKFGLYDMYNTKYLESTMNISAFKTLIDCYCGLEINTTDKTLSDYVSDANGVSSELDSGKLTARYYNSDRGRTCAFVDADSYSDYFIDCELDGKYVNRANNEIVACPIDTKYVYYEDIMNYPMPVAGVEVDSGDAGALAAPFTIAEETDENGTVHHILTPSALEEGVNIDETKDLASEEEPKEPVSTDDKPVAESPEAKDDESNDSDKEEDNVDKKFEDTSELEEVVDSTTTD